MNLLVINLDKGIFSPNSASLERLKEYSRLVDKIFVIVWTGGAEKSMSFDDKLFIYPTKSKFKFLYYNDTFKLAEKIIKENKIDLIFTQDPFETGLAGWRIAKRFKLPLQLQVHTDFLSPYFGRESFLNKIRVMLAKFLIPRANGLRVVSERIKVSIQNTIYNIQNTKITVLPIFVDVKKIESAPVNIDLRKKYPQFDFVVLMASRFSKEKNIEMAIGAMRGIIKIHPKTGLVIVGDGKEKENYESRIGDYKLGDNIKIEGWSDDLASYYKTADLFLLTSNYEGYGMSVVEAMAAHCLVAMTDVGLAGDVIKNNYNGSVVPVGDKKGLEDAMLKMINDKSLRYNLILSAQKTADEMASKEEYLAKYKKSWEICLQR